MADLFGEATTQHERMQLFAAYNEACGGGSKKKSKRRARSKSAQPKTIHTTQADMNFESMGGEMELFGGQLICANDPLNVPVPSDALQMSHAEQNQEWPLKVSTSQ